MKVIGWSVASVLFLVIILICNNEVQSKPAATVAGDEIQGSGIGATTTQTAETSTDAKTTTTTEIIETTTETETTTATETTTRKPNREPRYPKHGKEDEKGVDCVEVEPKKKYKTLEDAKEACTANKECKFIEHEDCQDKYELCTSLTTKDSGDDCLFKKDCDEGCDLFYNPVCGTDKTTYVNECSLRVTACETNDLELSVAHDGRCVGEPFVEGVVNQFSSRLPRRQDKTSCGQFVNKNSNEKFKSLDDATEQCSKDSKCSGVYDVDCDGKEYYLCPLNSTYPSKKSCTHMKPEIYLYNPYISETCDKCVTLDGPCIRDGDCVDGLVCTTEDCQKVPEGGSCCKKEKDDDDDTTTTTPDDTTTTTDDTTTTIDDTTTTADDETTTTI